MSRLIPIVAVALSFSACLNGCGGVDDTDTDTDTDTGTGTDTGSFAPPEEWVGEPCVEGGGRCAELSGGNPDVFCKLVDEERGFCTVACTPARYENAGTDPCGESGVCSDFTWLLGDVEPASFCVQACVPTGGTNPCLAEYLKCDPAAWAYEKATAVCLLPACEGSDSCPVPVGAGCEDDGDCDEEGGEECQDLEGVRQCVFFGECSSKNGRCTHDGADEAKVGDPCDVTYDCGDNMICLPPGDGPAALYPGGYCSKAGCSAVTPNNHGVGNQTLEIAVLDVFGCGALGVCHQGYYGGRCFKRCDPLAGPDQALGCRQTRWGSVVGDSAGDYDCYDQTAFIEPAYAIGDPSLVGAPSTATSPYCSWVGSDQRCTGGMVVPPNDSMTCEDLFGRKDQGIGLWGIGMECRNRNTGQIVDSGYCLDETTSHWTGAWSDSVQDAGAPQPDGGTDAGATGGPDAGIDAGKSKY